MLRASRTFRCSAATTTTTPSAAAQAASTEKAAPAQWQNLPIHRWMQQQRQSVLSSHGRRQPLFFGPQCGPNAGLFFPPAAAGCSGDLSAFTRLFSGTNYEHGFLSLSYGPSVAAVASRLEKSVEKKRALACALRGDCSSRDGIVQQTQRKIDLLEDGASEDDQNFFTEYCHDVVSTMDRIGVGVSAVAVAQSFGALVAAKMALLYPERVGTVFLLPPPPAEGAASKKGEEQLTQEAHLITDDSVSFAKELRELRKAAVDINISTELYDFSVQEFETWQLSGAVGGGSADDATLIGAALAEGKFSSHGESKGMRPRTLVAEADVNAWMSMDQLRLMQHPMCLVASPGSTAEISAHESFFNVKRVAKMKKGKSGGDDNKSSSEHQHPTSRTPLDPGCVFETADHLSNWIKRFDADELVQRKWLQAKADMEKLLLGDGSAGAGKKSGGAEEGGKKKKKGKKDKNQ